MQVTTVMTEREKPEGPTDDLVAKTKSGEPNINVVARPWYVMVLVRVGRVYLSCLFSLPVMSKMTNVGDIDSLTSAMIAACFPAIFSLLLNAFEILTKLDTHATYSTYRA